MSFQFRSPEFVFAALGLCFSPLGLGCAHAQPGEFPAGEEAGAPADSLAGTRRVQAHLVLEVGALAPGETVELAVIFEIEPEWHLYWRNPGDSGLPPTVTLHLPEGITAGPPLWPAPQRQIEAGLILDYTFADHLVLWFPLRIANSVPTGDAEIRADLSWLVCRDVCVPGERTVRATFPVTRDPVRPFLPPSDRTILQAARERVPQTTPPEGLETSWKEETLSLRVPGATALTFFPYESEDYVFPLDGIEHGSVDGDRMTLTYASEVRSMKAIGGVLAVEQGGRPTFHEISIPVEIP